MRSLIKRGVFQTILATALLTATIPATSFARDIEYKNEEVNVYVTPGEPTQIQFPGNISGGFKRKQSSVSLDKKGTDLIVFAQDNIDDTGEALIVRLEDGRSFSIRVKRSGGGNTRDTVVRIDDVQGSIIDANKDEEEAPYKEKTFEYAPPSNVSGFMRELVLAAEFGKSAISGYRMSDKYRGQTVLHDGTMHAKIDRIFIGQTLWGYVVEAENLLDQTQKINPASFRIDGTRAISAQNWELAPRPLNVEQEAAQGHKAKIYIITRAK